MRISALLFGTSLACLITSMPSNAAITSGALKSSSSTGSATSFVVVPYTAGSTGLFSSSIVNVSNAVASTLPVLSGNNAGPAPQGGVKSRQGGLGFATIGLGFAEKSSLIASDSGSGGNLVGTSSAGFSSANNTSGTSSAGYSSANNTSGTSSMGFSSANYTIGTSSAGSSFNSTTGSTSSVRPLLVLTSLVNSTDARVGSAGAVFQTVGSTQISTVSFQFGSVAAAAGQAGASSSSVSPMLAIDDQPNGAAVTTRYIPISSGTVTNSSNGLGLTSVTFNANQLLTNGQVQRIGVVLTQRGTVAIDNIQVNGVSSNGIVAQAQQSFPF